MFERFTDQARRVVVLAQEEARDLGHNYIGTEHILLGLIREEDGAAARALAVLEINLDAARGEIQEILGEARNQPPGGHIPFTPRTKKVLEHSLREALQLGVDYIGTEHVLLGLIREGEGVGVLVLERLGVTADQARAQVLDIIRGTRRLGGRPGIPARVYSSRGAVETLGGRVEEALTRLTEISAWLEAISARLTAIETVLAEGHVPPARAARKPPAAPRKPPASGRRKAPGKAAGAGAAGGEPPEQEPPAAQA
jgi:ATP-dependent Clp protease ATP-binding subunit ClpA